MLVYTIGFTQKPASRFFQLLREHGVRQVIDIRLNPTGQLSGFAKQDDLAWFLAELIGCDYAHLPALAPTEEIMKAGREGKNWPRYVEQFEALMDDRNIPDALDRSLFDDGPVCLLCSEAKPEQCHRSLVAARLQRAWPDVAVHHLV